jgi:transposase
MAICIQPANTQDRDGAPEPIHRARLKYQTLQKLWADSGYAGKCVIAVREATGCELEIVRRGDDTARRPWVTVGGEPLEALTFKVLRWRWVIERTFGWLGRYRRLSKDYEQNPCSSLAWVRVALVSMLIHRLGAAV